MTTLKDRLIRLGSTNPELRKDLKPILDHLTGKVADMDRVWETVGSRKELERIVKNKGIYLEDRELKMIDQELRLALADTMTDRLYDLRSKNSQRTLRLAAEGAVDFSYLDIRNPSDLQNLYDAVTSYAMYLAAKVAARI